MTTYTWPTGDTAFIPRAITFTHANGQVMNVSPLNGTTQSYGLPGDRLKVRLDFPRHSYAERARLEAFLRRLDGMKHRISLWDLARSVPQGNWTPAGVTAGSAAAQFAGSLALAGCYGINLTKAPQDIGGSTWGKGGTVGTQIIITANTTDTTAPDGTNTAERIDITSGGPRWVSEGLWASPNTDTYKWRSVYVKAGTISKVIYEGWSNTAFDAATGTGPGGSVIENVGGGWYRFSIRTTATITNHAIYLDVIGNAVNSGYLYIWGAQVYKGAVLPEYTPYAQATAGDWLQIPTSTGNQLAMVMADATANDAGAMTVEIRPMLRGAVSSGAAIVLDKPSALFVIPDRDLAIPRGGSGVCPEFSIDLYEVFA